MLGKLQLKMDTMAATKSAEYYQPENRKLLRSVACRRTGFASVTVKLKRRKGESNKKLMVRALKRLSDCDLSC